MAHRFVVAPLALAVLLTTACTPLGLARGDYWTGRSTGDLGPCPSFEFELAIDEGKVAGSATSEFEWGTTLWEIRGQVGDQRRVTLETRTQDPRVAYGKLSWTGTINPILWEITSAPDPTCPKPRTAKLQRR